MACWWGACGGECRKTSGGGVVVGCVCRRVSEDVRRWGAGGVRVPASVGRRTTAVGWWWGACAGECRKTSGGGVVVGCVCRRVSEDVRRWGAGGVRVPASVGRRPAVGWWWGACAGECRKTSGGGCWWGWWGACAGECRKTYGGGVVGGVRVPASVGRRPAVGWCWWGACGGECRKTSGGGVVVGCVCRRVSEDVRRRGGGGVLVGCVCRRVSEDVRRWGAGGVRGSALEAGRHWAWAWVRGASLRR